MATTSPSSKLACPAFVDPARVEWKLGSYGVAHGSALREVDPWLRAQDYRRMVSARMQALDSREVRSHLPAGEYLLSRKYDGEFTLLIFRDGEAASVNPGGTVRIGLPWLGEAARRLRERGVKNALIAGELVYIAAASGPGPGRERVHDVSRAARQPGGADDLDRLHFVAFDILEIDGAAPPSRYADVVARLQTWFGSGERARAIQTVAVKTAEEVDQHFARLVTQDGSEGLVLRSDSAGRFKIKPRHSIDAVVIGFSEAGQSGDASRKGMLHDLLLALLRPDGSLHILGHVGTGFSDDERRAMLSDLKDRVVDSDYREPSDSHVAYQMVRPEWVVEISCLDFISQTTRGASIDRMTLTWDAAGGRYAPLRRLPLVAMLSPVFIRRRDDKRLDAQDLRLSQVTDLVEVAKTDVNARQLTQPKSTLLRREVYTKTLKGQTLVRKLLLWQTHKQDSGDFPAFVLHLTDFSPTRKTPLEREVRVSSSREQIDLLWTELYEQNIVKGWSRVS